MKNVIIHPKDSSTGFLKPIYGSVVDKVVVEKSASLGYLNSLIKKSDRVMMMGHGSPRGLFSMNLFSRNVSGYIISDEQADILRDQNQNVYIWCHANEFVDFNNLHGFYSGMFISEVTEAYYCGLRNATQEMVDKSNWTFSEIVGDHVNLPKEALYDKVVEEYGKLAKINPVAMYNLKRLYVR